MKPSSRTLTLIVHGPQRVFFSENEYGETVFIDNSIADLGFPPFMNVGDVLFDNRSKQFCGLTFCFYKSFGEIGTWFDSQSPNAALRYRIVDTQEKLRSDPIQTFANADWPVDVFGHLDALFVESEILEIAPAQLGLGELYWWYIRETGLLAAISIPRFDQLLDNCCISLTHAVDQLPLVGP